jgi:dipeptidyl aminopeptidase/acylaminoacyl peptidase
MAAVGSAPRAGKQIGEGEQVSGFNLTDAAIERALAPGADVAAPSDFTDGVARAIAGTPRRPALWLLSPFAWPSLAPRMAQLLLVLLLLLVLVVAAIGVGSLVRRGVANGDVIVLSRSQLLAIDPHTGASNSLLAGEGRIFGVSRSLDGQLIAFWTDAGAITNLEVMDRTGGNRRRIAANVTPSPVGHGQIDVWSTDGRFLAAGVLVDGVPRILVVDVASGSGEIVGPVGAGNPLWSPDGQLLAFSYPDESDHSVLAVMRPDGSGVRSISGDIGEFNASGTNNFSPDGAWVYFGVANDSFSRSNIYRANVEAGYSEQLTFNTLSAAPALSPDGTTAVYSDWPGGIGTQNLMAMDAGGDNQHLLLASAINLGWSNDGQFVLAEWRPPGKAFELVVLRPDGTDRQTLLTFDGGCELGCVESIAWGQPRP